jgi:hypothetical protein
MTEQTTPPGAPDHRPERAVGDRSADGQQRGSPQESTPKPGQATTEKPAIISYVKPGMELYVAEEQYKEPGAPTGGKTAKTSCSCDLVCTCERVAACGCNLVRTRVPADRSLVCTCDTVEVCTCNTVSTCTCNRVATSVCSCNLVCTCDTVCRCERVGGGGTSRSVCRCVPVIH